MAIPRRCAGAHGPNKRTRQKPATQAGASHGNGPPGWREYRLVGRQFRLVSPVGFFSVHREFPGRMLGQHRLQTRTTDSGRTRTTARTLRRTLRTCSVIVKAPCPTSPFFLMKLTLGTPREASRAVLIQIISGSLRDATLVVSTAVEIAHFRRGRIAHFGLRGRA